MATITLRAVKGSPLTNTEVDANFTNLNNDKLEDITSESIKDLSDVNSGMTPTDGQLLTWDNANTRWSAADAPISLPDQTGNSGKYLTTDGTTASWAVVETGSGIGNLGLDIQNYSATAGQTTFDVEYTNSRVIVYVNGIKLDPSEYTATSGTDVVIGTALALGDAVNLIGMNLYSASNATSVAGIDRQTYTATEGQTTFNVAYVNSQVDVYRNGIKISSNEYTATSGTSIVLDDPCVADDAVDLIGFSTVDVENAATETYVDNAVSSYASTGKAIAMAIVFGG